MTRFIFAAFVFSFAATGCDNGTAAPPVDYAPMLAALTDDVAVPAINNAAATANALDAALVTLEASPNPTTLAAAQAAWRSARAAYRTTDALYFGPVITQGIDGRVDASPADDSTIDGIVSATSTIDATLIANLGDPAKGYLGIEYLLFTTSGPSAIATQIGGASCRSCTLARAMADEVASSVQALADAWNPAKGGYATQIKTAGAGSTVYPNQLKAVDDFVGGTSYALELVVGVRLAMPLGRKGNGTPDPTLDPTRASDSAVADMAATLAGIQNLYTDNGNGFTSRVAISSTTLNTEALSQLTACQHAVTIMPRPFASAVVNQTSVVTAAYTTCDTWKMTWDTEIASALGAAIDPDNDGD